jgi:hypothetical protein
MNPKRPATEISWSYQCFDFRGLAEHQVRTSAADTHNRQRKSWAFDSLGDPDEQGHPVVNGGPNGGPEQVALDPGSIAAMKLSVRYLRKGVPIE